MSTDLGRSKLTPQLVEVFCRAIAMGNYPSVACKLVGIHVATYRQWMRYGQDAVRSDDPYRQFYEAVKFAEASSEGNAVQAWQKHFPRNYKASRDFLARRFPDRWGPKYQLTIAVDREVQKMMELLRNRLPPEVFNQVVLALADEGASEMPNDGLGLEELSEGLMQEIQL